LSNMHHKAANPGQPKNLLQMDLAMNLVK